MSGIKSKWWSFVRKALFSGWLISVFFFIGLLFSVHQHETDKLSGKVGELAYNLLGFISHSGQQNKPFYVEESSQGALGKLIESEWNHDDNETFSYIWGIDEQRVVYSFSGKEVVPTHHKALIEDSLERLGDNSVKKQVPVSVEVANKEGEYHGGYITSLFLFSVSNGVTKKKEYLHIVARSTKSRDAHIALLKRFGYPPLLAFLVVVLSATFLIEKLKKESLK